MNLGHQGLMHDVTGLAAKTFPPHIGSSSFDLEKICSLKAIREHTKTDDVPSVTDDQLIRYRKAAFEAAEQYTGLLLSEHQQINEVVSKAGARRSNFIKHRLRHPSADGTVYAYGSNNGIPDQTINITPGDSLIRIMWISGSLDLSQCCGDGCNGGRPALPSIKLLYKAGVGTADQIPAGIVVGVLRWIAFSVQNAGDEILTVRNRAAKGDIGIIGSNNVALSSGALEMWQQYAEGL